MLEKGLTFSPMQTLDKFTLTKDVYLFFRKLVFKLLHKQPPLPHGLLESDQQTLQDLLDLLNEDEAPLDNSKFPLKTRSTSSPPLSLFPTVQVFYNIMCEEIRHLPNNTLSGRNLTSGERQAINLLKNNKTTRP